MPQVTLRTLAEQLQLSPGTVSKALRDSYEISEETKKKVLSLAKKMNYVPNAYASSLRKKKSNMIAVVLPEVADSFFSVCINGIESIAQKKAYHVLIYLTHENFLKEKSILHDFKSGRVDGVLLSVTRETKNAEHISDLQSSGVPIVFFDRVLEEIETAKVCTDDFESGYLATKHLIEKGCKNIAYLSISKDLAIANERMKGYEKALLDNKQQVKDNNLIACTNDEEHNYELIKKLLSQKARPDGIVASVEKFIITLYQVCIELKLNIPKDLKIVGFSIFPSASILNPPITTITQPAFEIGEAAAALLFKALEKSSFDLKGKRIILPSTLTVRSST
ncbi:MAG TPA: LacI family DNA-binding transcriptional regulator [Puia sp.]|nr:LacI family DNA-binding transcriptional regulator [Puia sp.]